MGLAFAKHQKQNEQQTIYHGYYENPANPLCGKFMPAFDLTIEIREYIDCSLAQPACLVLVE
jgi:hypothetical protein